MVLRGGGGGGMAEVGCKEWMGAKIRIWFMGCCLDCVEVGLDSDVLAVVGLRGVFACLRLCVTYNTLGGTIPTLIISGNGD